MLARLRGLRSQGLSAPQIAKRLNHEWGTTITRDSILAVWVRQVKLGVFDSAFRDAGPCNIVAEEPAAPVAGHRTPTAEFAAVTKRTHLSTSTDVSEPESGWSVFGLWADLHVGSIFADYDGIKSVQAYGAKCGVTDWFLAGDWNDGAYPGRGGEQEQCYIGLDSQVSATIDLLDQRPGQRHHIIDGNHGHRYKVLAGVRAGRHLQDSAIANGRSDIIYHGYKAAQATVRGLCVEMVHYTRGVKNAAEQWLQDRSDARLPDILVGGHYHIHLEEMVRGVRTVQPGSFQESDFMRNGKRHRIGCVIMYIQHMTNEKKRYLTEFVESGQTFSP